MTSCGGDAAKMKMMREVVAADDGTDDVVDGVGAMMTTSSDYVLSDCEDWSTQRRQQQQRMMMFVAEHLQTTCSRIVAVAADGLTWTSMRPTIPVAIPHIEPSPERPICDPGIV